MPLLPGAAGADAGLRAGRPGALQVLWGGAGISLQSARLLSEIWWRGGLRQSPPEASLSSEKTLETQSPLQGHPRWGEGSV